MAFVSGDAFAVDERDRGNHKGDMADNFLSHIELLSVVYRDNQQGLIAQQ